MKIYDSIEGLVGETKLFYVKRYCEKMGVKAKICVKLECQNPAGSIKDRAALYMINEAEKNGQLTKGATIIEPTSGNMGIGLAAIGRAKGYKVILTMPDTMSVERRNLLAAYGAEIHLTPGELGMKGSIEKAEKLRDQLTSAGEKCFIAGQFDNYANITAHIETTGPEIWQDTDGEVAAFVAGVGTGGTLSGTSKFLKSKDPKIHTVAVEPSNSQMIAKGTAGPHKLQGIGANFLPKNFIHEFCDEVIPITDDEAYRTGKEIAECEGILIGVSGAAAVAAALKLAKRKEYDGKVIVTITPDSGEHYLSINRYFN